MTKTFTKINPESLHDNPFKLIGTDWMLITAGNKDSFNTMTAAWGGLGILWSKPVVYCFVRPTRYTYKFMEISEYFTLSFFEENFREILKCCGNTSGRETDKMKETGLIPLESEKGSVYFEQARLVIECKKIYYDDIKPEHFLSKKINDNYPLKDYHRMYVGEIVNCLTHN